MRTDVKVGIAFGAVVLIIAVSYYGTKQDADIPIGDTRNGIQAKNSKVIDDLFAQSVPLQGGSGKQAGVPGKRSIPGEQNTSDLQSNKVDSQRTGLKGKISPADSKPPPPLVDSSEGIAVASPETTPAQAMPSETPAPEGGQPAVQQSSGVTKQKTVSVPLVPPNRSQLPKVISGNLNQPQQNPPVVVKTHVIQRGDTFSSLAERYYGSQRYARFLADANPGVEPYHMKIGAKIKVPPLSSKLKKPSSLSAPTAKDVYVVKEDDNLYRIAERLLGSGARWAEIYELNKELIGSDPSTVKVGQHLKLPPR